MRLKTIARAAAPILMSSMFTMTAFAGGGYSGTASAKANDYTIIPPAIEATLDKGSSVNDKLHDLANQNTTAIAWSSKSPVILGVDESEIVNLAIDGKDVLAFVDPDDTNRILIYSDAKTIYMNEDSASIGKEFYNVSDISAFGHFDASKVTTLNYAFASTGNWQNKTGGTPLDLSPLEKWNVASVVDFDYAFSECSSVESVYALRGWNTANAESMISTFYDCESLESLNPLSDWNVAGVKSLRAAFADTYALTSLSGISTWNVSNVADFEQTFAANAEDKAGLADISALRGWDMSAATTANRMFCNQGKISDVAPISGWKVTALKNADSMFYNCQALNDASMLESWKLGTGVIRTDVFKNSGVDKIYNERHVTNQFPAWYLYEYYFCDDYTLLQTVSIPAHQSSGNILYCDMIKTPFKNNFILKEWTTHMDGNGEALSDAEKQNSSYGDYYKMMTDSKTKYYAQWKSDIATVAYGTDFNKAVKSLTLSGTITFNTPENDIRAFRHSSKAPADGIKTVNIADSKSKNPILAWYDDGTVYWYSEANHIETNVALTNAFYNFQSLYDFSGVEDWDTSNLTSIESAFRNCYALTDLNYFNGWNTAKLANMAYAFDGDTGIGDLAGISSWDLSSISTCGYMFRGCTGISDLSPLANWDLSNLKSGNLYKAPLSSMFAGCSDIDNASCLTAWDINPEYIYSDNGGLNSADAFVYDMFAGTKIEETYANDHTRTDLYPTWMLRTFEFYTDENTLYKEVTVPINTNSVYLNIYEDQIEPPARSGYIFTGWQYADGFECKKTNGYYQVLCNHKNVYAKWEALTASLTLDANGGQFEDGTTKMVITNKNAED